MKPAHASADRRRHDKTAFIRSRSCMLLAVIAGVCTLAAWAAEPASRPECEAQKAAKNPAKIPGLDPNGTIAAYQARLKDMPKFDQPLMFNTPAADAALKHVQVFPANSPFNENVATRPVAANSEAMIATMKDRKTLAYNLDMTYILVPADQKLVPVKITDYADESDAGPLSRARQRPHRGLEPRGQDFPGRQAGQGRTRRPPRDRRGPIPRPAV